MPPASLQPDKKVNSFWKTCRIVFSKTIFCLLCLFVLGIVLKGLTHKFERLNAVADKIEDTHLSDLFFVYMNDKTVVDTNVIIVNCANDNLQVIGQKLEKICKADTKSVGLDIEFSLSHHPGAEGTLLQVISAYKDKIIIADVGGREDANAAKPAFYRKLDSVGTKYIYGALPIENRLEVKRYFHPFEAGTRKGSSPFAMAVVTTAGYNMPLLQKRHNSHDPEALEVINFKKTISGMDRYTVTDTVPPDSLLNGKIVLLGGWDTTLIVDKHYTPLNGVLGRSLPDMYGVEYQAHIISMLLADRGVNEKSEYLDEPSCMSRYLLVSLAIFMCMFLFDYVHHQFQYSGHLVNEIIIVVIISPLLFMLFGHIFRVWHYLLEPNHFIIPIFFSALFLSLYEAGPGKVYRWLMDNVRNLFKKRAGKLPTK